VLSMLDVAGILGWGLGPCTHADESLNRVYHGAADHPQELVGGHTGRSCRASPVEYGRRVMGFVDRALPAHAGSAVAPGSTGHGGMTRRAASA
jgi:hypothetical protein